MYRYQHVGKASAQKQRERPKIRINAQNGPSGTTLAIVLCFAIAITGFGLGLASFLNTQSNGDTIVVTRTELETLIEERIMSINNVNPMEASKKRTVTEGGIELLNQDNSIVITTNPSEHEIYLNTNENILQKRIENFCGPDTYATAVLVNGSIVCNNLNIGQPNGIAPLTSEGLLSSNLLPVSTLEYICTYDAQQNLPELSDEDCGSTYRVGQFFIVSVANDTTVLSTVDSVEVQDWILCSNVSGMPTWERNAHSVLTDYQDLLNRPTPTCTGDEVIQGINEYGDPMCTTAGLQVDGTPTDGQLLQYDGMTMTWKPYSIPYAMEEDVLETTFQNAMGGIYEHFVSLTLAPGTYSLTLTASVDGYAKTGICIGSPGSLTILNNQVLFSENTAQGTQVTTTPQLITISTSTTYYGCTLSNINGGVKVFGRLSNEQSCCLPAPYTSSRLSAIRLA